MPDIPSEAQFGVNIVGDRIVEYSESNTSVKFAFDLNVSGAPNSIFLESKPMFGPIERLSRGFVDKTRLKIVLTRISASLKSKGYHVIVVND